MKRYRTRLFGLNLLIVVSALALTLLIINWLVPASVSPVAWLMPALTALVSAVAFLVGICEAAYIYRDWKADAENTAGKPKREKREK